MMRKWAEKIVAAGEASKKFTAEAKAKIAADQKERDALAAEIAELVSQGSESVSAFNLLPPKRERLAFLDSQLPIKKEAPLREAEARTREAWSDLDLVDFWKTAFELVVGEGTKDFTPYFENEGRARNALAQSDALNALDRWRRILVHEVPAEVQAERLKKFVNGEKPLWQV